MMHFLRLLLGLMFWGFNPTFDILVTAAETGPSSASSILLTPDFSVQIKLTSSWSNCGTQTHITSNVDSVVSMQRSDTIPSEGVSSTNETGIENHKVKQSALVRTDQDTMLYLPTVRFTPHCKLFFVYGREDAPLAQVYWEIEHLRLISNTKRDYFLFIGPKDIIMNKVFQNLDMANGIRHKLGLDTETGEIWYQSKSYGEPLHTLDLESVLWSQASQGIPPPVRINLRNRVIRVTAAPIPPFVQKSLGSTQTSRHLSPGKYFGSNFEPIQTAALKYNFTIEMNLGSRAQGVKFRNGSWNGVSGDLVRREADLAVLLAQDLDRYDALDLSGSHFGIFKIVFTTVQPLVSIHPEALVYPYEKHVWALIILSLLIITPLFRIYFKYDAQHQRRRFCARTRISLRRGGHGQRLWPRMRRVQDDHWWQAISIAFKIATEQDIPRRMSQRLRPLTGLWMLSIIIITTGYKSNLLTFLTLPYKEQLPDSFPTLAINTKYTDYTIYYHDVGGADFKFFDGRQTELARRLRDRFILEKDMSRCMVKSLAGHAKSRKTICMGWDTILSQIVAQNLTLVTHFEPLRFVEAGSPFIAYAVMAMQKNSIFTDAINFIGSSFYETGLIDLWRAEVRNIYKKHGKEWMLQNRNEETKMLYERLWDLTIGSRDVRKAFGLKHFEFVFGALLAGCGMALLVFVVEFVFGTVY